MRREPCTCHETAPAPWRGPSSVGTGLGDECRDIAADMHRSVTAVLLFSLCTLPACSHDDPEVAVCDASATPPTTAPAEWDFCGCEVDKWFGRCIADHSMTCFQTLALYEYDGPEASVCTKLCADDSMCGSFGGFASRCWSAQCMIDCRVATPQCPAGMQCIDFTIGDASQAFCVRTEAGP